MNNRTIEVNKKRHYYIVDILKFIFCIFIIALHTNLMSFANEDIQWWIEKCLFRLAVPFFFLTSGFLVGNKFGDYSDIASIKKVY